MNDKKQPDSPMSRYPPKSLVWAHNKRHHGCDYSVFVTEQTDGAFPTLAAILLALMTVQSSLLAYHTLHTAESQRGAKQLEAYSECQKRNSLPCTEFNATAIPAYWQGSVCLCVCVCVMVV